MSYWSPFGQKGRHGLFDLAMRVLITGGFGFIGSHVAVHLAQAGCKVTLGTRSSMKAPKWLPQAEVEKIVWTDEIALNRSCAGFDVIIHAAGMNAQDCAVNPVAALEFNGVATARLVKAAGRGSVKNFIYLSTAHVYGSPLVGVISEETCPRNLHSYATSHLAGEYAVLDANNRGEFQGIVLRLSNVFGVPMDQDMNCWMLLVNNLCKQAVEIHKLVLKSSGFQQRDFINLREVSRTIGRLAVDFPGPTQTNIFNVGAGVSHSVLSMAQLIQKRCSKILGFQPELQRKADEADEADEDYSALIYKTDNLNSLGFGCTNLDNIAEIDRLLLFCENSYNKAKKSN